MDWIRRNVEELQGSAMGQAVELGRQELATNASNLIQDLGQRMEPLGKQIEEVGSSSWEKVKTAVSNSAGGGSGNATRSMLPARFGDVEAPTSASGRKANGHVSDLEDIPASSWAEELGEFTSMSLTQRMAAFAMFFGAGGFMTFMSLLFLPTIVLHPAKFALSFTFGNLLCIASTWFLVGPRAQLQSMFDPSRRTAASVYVGSLLFTLIFAFFGGSMRYLLVLISVIIEVLALVWYTLSYVPYGRDILKRCCGLLVTIE